MSEPILILARYKGSKWKTVRDGDKRKGIKMVLLEPTGLRAEPVPEGKKEAQP